MEYIEVCNQNQHMQGFTSDAEHKYMFWSFTDSVVKTNMNGTMICQIHCDDSGHLGGMDWHDGKVYVSFMANPSPWTFWNDWSGFYIFVYDDHDLHLIEKIKLDECMDMKKNDVGGFQGIDGIAFGKAPDTGEERMFVAVATNSGEQYAHEMILQIGPDNKIEKVHYIPNKNTVFGIQNLDYEADTGCFWITTYGQKYPYQAEETLYRIAPTLDRVEAKYKFSTPYGFECLGNGEYYCSIQSGTNGHRNGVAYKCTSELFDKVMTEEESREFFAQFKEN